MANTERIAWINRALTDCRTMTASTIAKKFEVSEKTAKRDIEYLRDRCLAPVVWNTARRSYEYQGSWHGLDFLDEHSLLASSFLKAILGQFNYVPVVADSLEQSFVEQLPDTYRDIVESIVYELPQFEPIPDALVYEICRSISRRVALHIEYVNASDERKERDVEPWRLVNYSGKWYVVAYDHLKEGLRTFSLSRVVSFSSTDIPFFDDARTGVNQDEVDRFVRSAYGIYKGLPIGSAILRFYGAAASNVRHSIWHQEQSMRDYADPDRGSAVELELPVHDYPELLGRALRCGSSCEVVAPPEFRAMWLDEIRKMAHFADKTL